MNRRIKVVFVLFCISFLIIALKLWSIQILHEVRFQKMSIRNRTRLVRLPSGRGQIYDRRGRLLVDNQAATQLVVVAAGLEDKRQVAQEVSVLTRLRPEYILEKIRESIFRPFIPVVLAGNMNEEMLVRVAEAKWYLPGIDIQIAPIRNYLMGKTAAHVIGYIGRVQQGDLRDGYGLSDIVGRTGIERAYDKQLRGEDGHKEVQVDYRGNIDKVLQVTQPVTGPSLFLTIDADIQQELYEALDDFCGAGVVMDPRSGAVLAMASVPAFNPNKFTSPVKEDVVSDLFRNKKHPLVNRAISGMYAPGSVFKIIVALAALEDNKITADTLFFCNGSLPLGDTLFHCWRRGGHGWLDLGNALKRSCNVFFYKTGLRIGPGPILDMAARFGLGRKTGINLLGEQAGYLFDYDSGRDNWYPGDTVNLSIGHGRILVTPIQMASFISLVANGGILYKPKLVLDSPSRGDVVGIDKKHLELVKQGLFRVVNDAAGTGHRAYVKGLDIAGKTGTVELKKGQDKNVCWFIGFCPFNDPQVALAIVVEGGESGGQTAAPIARRIFGKWKKIYDWEAK